VFQITIPFLYIIAGVAFAMTRLSRFSERSGALLITAFIIGLAGLIWHCQVLFHLILMPNGIALSMSSTASFIGLQLALIAIIGAIEPSLRGLAGGLLLLGAAAASVTGLEGVEITAEPRSWQLQAHILIALFFCVCRGSVGFLDCICVISLWCIYLVLCFFFHSFIGGVLPVVPVCVLMVWCAECILCCAECILCFGTFGVGSFFVLSVWDVCC